MKLALNLLIAILICVSLTACQNEVSITPTLDTTENMAETSTPATQETSLTLNTNICINTELTSLAGKPFGYFKEAFGWKLSDLTVFHEGPPVGEYVVDNIRYVFNNYLGYEGLSDETPCATIIVRYTDLLRGLADGTLTEEYLIGTFGDPVMEYENRKAYRFDDIDMYFESDVFGDYADTVELSYAYPLDLYEPRPAKNPLYTLFYGEWEVTDRVYVDPMPTKDSYYHTDAEIESAKEFYRDSNRLTTIQFAPDFVVVNGDTVTDIRYDCEIFPANDDYRIHFTMTLKDIGLSEEQGSYFAFVEVDSAPGVLTGFREFFVKDVDTLIFYWGAYCIEYKRVSYEGGSEEPSFING